MSSHSYTSTCPNCNNEMNVSSSNRPYEQTSGDCSNCGFMFNTYGEYMSLESLNDRRQEDYNNLEHEEQEESGFVSLNELPEQDEEYETMPQTIWGSYLCNFKKEDYIIISTEAGVFFNSEFASALYYEGARCIYKSEITNTGNEMFLILNEDKLSLKRIKLKNVKG